MKMHTKYLGTVSYAPHHDACYVRVKVSRPGEKLPLSIKASFAMFSREQLVEGMFSREQLVEGTIVQVTRSSETDHTKYRLVDVS